MMTATHTSGPIAARQLPAKPNLEHLKNEAKQRLDALRARTPAAKLAEAQHQLAREYGFANWRELKADVEGRATGPLPAILQAALGDWIGKLPGGHRMAAHIRLDADGELSLTMDHRDLGFFGQAAEDVGLDGDRLTFSTATLAMAGPQQQVFYEFRWDAGRARWVGTGTVQGVEVPIELERGTWPPAPRLEGLHGIWDARLETKEGLIRLILRFRTDRRGTFAWLDSPDRNLLGRPAVSLSLEGRDVVVAMQTVRIEGRLSDDGEAIEGQFLKGDSKVPLIFLRRPPGAAPPLAQRAPAIDLPPEALAKFAGQYAYETGTVITLTIRDGRLWYEVPGGEITGTDGQPRTQASGGPPLDLLASSPTTFFFRILEVTVDFELDAEGAVTALVQRQGGRDARATRFA